MGVECVKACPPLPLSVQHQMRCWQQAACYTFSFSMRCFCPHALKALGFWECGVDDQTISMGCFYLQGFSGDRNINMCVLSRFGCVQLFVALRTVACQAPLLMGFSRQEILEWVAMPSSRGSSWARDRTCVSYVSALAGEFFTTRDIWEHRSHATGDHRDISWGVFPQGPQSQVKWNTADKAGGPTQGLRASIFPPKTGCLSRNRN